MTKATRVQRLAGNAFALAVGGIVAQLAYLGIEAFIARRLGVPAYGTFSTAFTYGFMLMLVLDMGMNARLLQDAAQDFRTTGRNLGTMLALKIAAFVVLFPLVLAASALADYGPKFQSLMAIMAVYALVLTARDTIAAVFGAQQRTYVGAMFQTTVPPLTLAVLVGARHFGQTITLDAVGMSYLVAVAVTTLAWFYLTVRTVGSIRAEFGHFRRVIEGSYLYGLTTLVSQFSSRSGHIVLSLMRNWTGVAALAVPFRIVTLGCKLPELAARVLTPNLLRTLTMTQTPTLHRAT